MVGIRASFGQSSDYSIVLYPFQYKCADPYCAEPHAFSLRGA